MSFDAIPPPATLYKYRALGAPGSQERTFLRTTFTHHEVYFASSRDFNDPFDCKIYKHFEGTAEEWLAYYRSLMHDTKPGLTPDQREQEALRQFHGGRYKDPEFQRRVLADLQCDAHKLGIFCVSTRNNSLAMWARYADGHRGVCLAFDHVVDLFHPPLSAPAAQEVRYSDTLPVLSFLNSDDALEVDLLTKSMEWRDEHEHRFLDPVHGVGVRNFIPGGLIGVIFGCRTPEHDRQMVQEWIAAGKARPKLYECVIKSGEYGVAVRSLGAAAIL